MRLICDNFAGYCLAKLGRYADAIADYDCALGLEPHNANAFHNRWALLRTHSPCTRVCMWSGYGLESRMSQE